MKLVRLMKLVKMIFLWMKPEDLLSTPEMAEKQEKKYPAANIKPAGI